MISKQLSSLNSPDDYAAYIREIERRSISQKRNRPEYPSAKESAKGIETSESPVDSYTLFVMLPCVVLMIAGVIIGNVELAGFSMLFFVSTYILTALIHHRYGVNIFGLLHTRVIRRKHYRQLTARENHEDALARELHNAERFEWIKENEAIQIKVEEILTSYNSQNSESVLVFENSRFSIDTVSLSDLRVNAIVDGFSSNALKI